MFKKNIKSDRKYKAVKVSDCLSKVNEKLLSKFGKVEYIISTKWKAIVGDFFSNYSEPLKVTSIQKNVKDFNESHKDKILHVNVSPAAALEFQHLKNKILEKINSFFGYKAINGIKIHQKMIGKKPSDLKKLRNEKKINLNEKKTKILNTIEKINDKELEKSLFNLGISISENEENKR
mgnify:CR=1 FL=1|tara:strand:- start:302 stop:835 length:534 start_codon:yes stop_codon:yes gene_type:complete